MGTRALGRIPTGAAGSYRADISRLPHGGSIAHEHVGILVSPVSPLQFGVRTAVRVGVARCTPAVWLFIGTVHPREVQAHGAGRSSMTRGSGGLIRPGACFGSLVHSQIKTHFSNHAMSNYPRPNTPTVNLSADSPCRWSPDAVGSISCERSLFDDWCSSLSSSSLIARYRGIDMFPGGGVNRQICELFLSACRASRTGTQVAETPGLFHCDAVVPTWFHGKYL